MLDYSCKKHSRPKFVAQRHPVPKSPFQMAKFKRPCVHVLYWTSLKKTIGIWHKTHPFHSHPSIWITDNTCSVHWYWLFVRNEQSQRFVSGFVRLCQKLPIDTTIEMIGSHCAYAVHFWQSLTNPDAERWLCSFLTNSQYQWLFLSECRITDKGIDYQGHVSVTESGIKCQRWNSQLPHKHQYTKVRGGEGVRGEGEWGGALCLWLSRE